ncbi:MAG: ATP-dependent DNA helicase RecG [Chloroflexi bacterium RBG_13_60_13]|nr:MAG: ATP-dependent DNA helicase RecG [Chloroflexi bacterium RBG_13_60_13]
MATKGVEALAKILELEQAGRYGDAAVIGGLDAYLRWHLNNAGDEGRASFLSTVCPRGFRYAHLTQDQRKEWVERVHRYLNEASVGRDASTGLATAVKSEAVSSSTLDSPITVLNGVGHTTAERFAKLGIRSIKDLLYLFPSRHLDYAEKRTVSELEPGAEQTLVATVWEARRVILGGRPGAEAVVGDRTGTVRAVWFNQPYLARTLAAGARIALSGKVGLFKGRKVFSSPEWEMLGPEDLTHTGRLVPVYPLTEGLNRRTVRKLMRQLVFEWAPQVADFLPSEMKDHCSLMDLPQAIRQAHYPDNEQMKEESRRRLAFDEFFLIQAGLCSRKLEWQDNRAAVFRADSGLLSIFEHSLPFSLTPAQRRVLDEILAGLGNPRPMCRLLQGDVGSGKTVIATVALLVVAASNCQGAFMVPTEVLAEQHFHNISKLLSRMGEPQGEEGLLLSFPSVPPYPFTMALLTGSLRQGEKRRIHQLVKQGDVHLVIGTHALIQKGVEFDRLGLAVVDEQHRFGVLQRSALQRKGSTPHVLVMTATPIPRTLALTIYGDLDLSVIDQLPPGRVDIETRWLGPSHRETAYGFIRRAISEGRQAFIVCPLVDESEAIEATAAVAEYGRLSQEVFPDLRLGLLHGRMPGAEKEAVMRRFRDGHLDVLVCTPVVEVGIDVPNAVVMLIEGAERFGLSQLHQFRGRVGRGEHKSYCILLSGTASMEAKQRLRVIEQTRDGFLLAEEDLRMRGPGEFFGTQQSGFPELRMARLSDVALLDVAREQAALLLQRDPGLKRPEHRLLADEVARLWRRGGEST